MGSMKQKRRKKALKEWAEFQSQHDLSDDDLKLAPAPASNQATAGSAAQWRFR